MAAGGAIYIRNCMYCHGDNLDGQGHFAAGFNPPPAELRRARHHRDASEGLPVLAHRQGRPGAAQGVDALELGDAGLGGPADRGADLAGDHVPLRGDGPAAPGDGLARVAAACAGHRAGTPGRRVRVRAPAGGGADGRSRAGQARLRPPLRGLPRRDGKGDGPAAELLVPRPRDFTAGKYKIRTVAKTLDRPGPLPDHHRRDARDLHARLGVLPEKDRVEPRGVHQDVRRRPSRAPKLELRVPRRSRPRRRRSGGARRCSRRSSATSATARPGGATGPGVRAEGRLGASDPARQPPQALDVPGWGRAAGGRDAAPDRRAGDADARDRRFGGGLPEVRREDAESGTRLWHLTNYILSLGPDRPAWRPCN